MATFLIYLFSYQMHKDLAKSLAAGICGLSKRGRSKYKEDFPTKRTGRQLCLEESLRNRSKLDFRPDLEDIPTEGEATEEESDSDSEVGTLIAQPANIHNQLQDFEAEDIELPKHFRCGYACHHLIQNTKY